MKSCQKIVSFLLSLVIIMIHVTLLVHTIENHHTHHETKFSSFSTLENKIEISEKCKLFDIYLDIKFSSVSNFLLPLFIADYDVDKVAKKEDHFITVFLHYNQSRSPPKFLTKTS